MIRAWQVGLSGALIAGIAGLYVLSPSPTAFADKPLLPVSVPIEVPVKIVFMGTSLTAGTPWPDAVIAQLEVCLKHPMRAFRIAQGGATSAWGLAQIEKVVASAPDLVILEFAINDADLRRGLSLRQSRDNHLGMILRLQQGLPDARIILMTTNPAAGLRRLLRPRLAAYYALYSDLAEQQTVGLIDMYPRWQARPSLAQDLMDGVHPSAASATLVIVPVVTAYVASVLGGCKS